MEMKSVIFLIGFALLKESSNAAIIPRIIGGELADIKEFPYQASLRNKGKHFCGGCIISNKHILTAAHCVENDVPPYRDLSVSIGCTSSVESGNSHRIAKITIHPGWKRNDENDFNNDIAVITLLGIIKFDEKQQMSELPSHNVVSGTRAKLAGWGCIYRKAKLSAKLYKIELSLLDNTNCQFQHSEAINKGQLCAYYSKDHGPCYGDSGSPLVVNNVIVGIASWIYDKTCATGKPDVYTNVYHYKNFIESAMKKL